MRQDRRNAIRKILQCHAISLAAGTAGLLQALEPWQQEKRLPVVNMTCLFIAILWVNSTIEVRRILRSLVRSQYGFNIDFPIDVTTVVKTRTESLVSAGW